MSEIKRPKIEQLNKRANLPRYVRFGAVGFLALTLLAIGIGFYVGRKNDPFRIRPEHAQLSKDIIAEVSGYERMESDGDVRKFYIKADKATTFADNHQELQNVYLQVFEETGQFSDQITAQKAIYIPGEIKNFTAYFAGTVNIETRDALKVRTEQIFYKKETDTAEAEELVEFERANVVGKSLGAIVKIKEKRLELLKDVEINAFATDQNDELARSNIQTAKITANSAVVDQTTAKIELTEKVFIGIIPLAKNAEMSQPTDIHADRAVASFEQREIRKIDLFGNVDVYQKPTNANSKWTRTKADKATANILNELKSVELTDNVQIETATNNAQPTKISSGYALYEKEPDRFQLRNGVHILTVEDAKPTHIRSLEAVYEQTVGKIVLTGNAEIDNGSEYVKGDAMTAMLYPNKKLQNSNVRGNAYLKQTTPDQLIEVFANELNAAFNENQQLQTANAIGSSRTVLVPTRADEYSKVTMSAPGAIHLVFRGAGLLERMDTDGRTTINLTAPAGRADAANKRLIADEVKTFLNANGKDLSRAEAIGNAELFVDPLQNLPANYKTTVNAPRFDCEFFPTGNNAKSCVAQTKTKTVRTPTVPAERRGVQTVIADKLTAQFDAVTQDISRMDAVGSTKFTELDRNAIADSLSFTSADEYVRLRGGEPTVWDSAARARGDEIDWDTRANKSFIRGNVSTTYYSQKQTKGAMPFGQTTKPVYVTSATAEFDHSAETGLYTGNARAWQENNYVRADKLFMKQKEGQLFADGAVQSVLYDTKKKEKGKETSVPAYASANKMFYNRDSRMIRYEENVDMRQATDRITAGKADIFLNEKNELSKTIAETNVVITQPGRKAVGDWVQYTADNEIAILRGNPARIDDAENGTSQGAQMTVYMRENRVVGEAKTEDSNSGRTRTVYKVKKND